MKFVTRYLGTTCTAALLLAVSVAQAEEAAPPPPAATTASSTADDGTLQEIVVTAQKRSENIQKVPVAVTAFTADTLNDLGVKDVNDLTGLAPSLQIKSADASANPKIFIRGIGSNDFNPTSSNAVGIYVDGAYIGSPLAQGGQFFDLERVEVLRGPQGTLYGRNTTGGAINIITAKPTQDLEGYASAEYGNYNTLNLEGAVSDAIVKDKLAVRIAATYSRNDGYTENRVTGHDVNNTNKWAGRLTFLFTPNEDFEMTTQFRGGKLRNGAIMGQNREIAPGGTFFGLFGYGYADHDGDPFAGDYNIEGTDAVDLFGVSNNIKWDLGSASLVSISALDWSLRDDVEDTDSDPENLIESRYKARQYQVSQELRLQSNGDTPLAWVAGIYYAHESLKVNNRVDALVDLGYSPPDAIGDYYYPYEQRTDSYAAFGQADYKVTDKLTATVGLRYSADFKDFNYDEVGNYGTDHILSYDKSKHWSSLSGRLGLKYQITDAAQVYATYNRGYKGGGFSGVSTTVASDLGPYNDESVNAYEVGSKIDITKKLRLNTSAFYYDYKDLQVYTLVPRGLTTAQILDNASAAKVYGLEAEVQARPLEGLTLSLGASLLHSEYENFKTLDSSGNPVDNSGNTMVNAPKLSLDAGAYYEYALSGGDAIVTTLNGNYKAKVYTDTGNTERLAQGPVLLVDGRLGWRSPDGAYETGIWGKNILDKKYVVDTVPLDSLNFDILYYGDPRTFGVYFKTNF